MTKVENSVIGLLLDVPLFGSMGTAALARLAVGASEVNVRGKSVIFRRGEACRGLYVVCSGQVKLTLEAAQGGEQVVELVAPGGILGETALFLDGPHVLSAETLSDTVLLHVTKAAILSELERTPEFTRVIITILSRRLEHVIGALEDCTLRSGTERVVGYLLNQLSPDAVNGHAMVTLPAKKGVIASQLNLTHEHFSRILRGLTIAAMIEVDGSTVRIRDVDQLRTHCLQS
ncbi:MAG TPA: Crp/Fnr family transcriptional regulator [Burkholderiales bacterium]|nr:Crp/Fnr family transcriptional regulator [Burkholderiales bacterium]